MVLNQYETVFILTPVLSAEQMKDTVEKFKQILIDGGAEIEHQEDWGLKKLAYPIRKKNTGFYTVIQFKSPPELIKTLDTEYRRDEKVIRHLVVSLDKFAVAYAEKRRQKKLTESKTEKE
jgi:small subunit ribosomal protein S6